MLYNWVILHRELIATARARPSHPLDDPLNAPEWQGLTWALPLISALGNLSLSVRPRRVRSAPVLCPPKPVVRL